MRKSKDIFLYYKFALVLTLKKICKINSWI